MKCPECNGGGYNLDYDWGMWSDICSLCNKKGKVGILKWLKYKIDQFFSRRMPI